MQMLRVDPVNLICTIINLLILYFLIRKFLFKPVRNILAQREEQIKKSYADAEAVNQEASALKQQYEKSLDTIEEERTQAMSKTREDAAKEYARIVDNAQTQADKLLADARVQADQESRAKVKEATDQIADLVTEAASRIAATKNSSDNDLALYDAFLKEAAADNKTENGEKA